MSKKVYGLKRATPRMKFIHMNHVMQWKDNLRDIINHPLDRHVALAHIHAIIGSDFETWYNEVYKLRAADRHAEYEQAIFQKLEELTGSDSAPLPSAPAPFRVREGAGG